MYPTGGRRTTPSPTPTWRLRHRHRYVVAYQRTNILPSFCTSWTSVRPARTRHSRLSRDTICGELDAPDVPHELRTRFADGAEVMEVSILTFGIFLIPTYIFQATFPASLS